MLVTFSIGFTDDGSQRLVAIYDFLQSVAKRFNIKLPFSLSTTGMWYWTVPSIWSMNQRRSWLKESGILFTSLRLNTGIGFPLCVNPTG